MSPLTRRATLRHIDIIERRRSPLRRALSRINPSIVIGALLMGAVLAYIGTGAPQSVECRPVRGVHA